MKIKQIGYKILQEREYQCTTCSCLFTYLPEDIGRVLTTDYDAFDALTPPEERTGWHTYTGLKCPCCGKCITMADLQQRSKTLCREYLPSEVYSTQALVIAQDET